MYYYVTNLIYIVDVFATMTLFSRIGTVVHMSRTSRDAYADRDNATRGSRQLYVCLAY